MWPTFCTHFNFLHILCVRTLKNHMLTEEPHYSWPPQFWHLSSKDCMSAALIGCEKKRNTQMLSSSNRREMCLGSCSELFYPTGATFWEWWAVWVKSKWGMFYGFEMMFLNSDLFVARPPTGDEQPYKLDFFTHSSDGRAAIHCSGCTYTLVDRSTQLICIWIFICWVGDGDTCLYKDCLEGKKRDKKRS